MSDAFARGSSVPARWPTGVQLGLEVQHLSCHETGDGDAPPVMDLEHVEYARARFVCPVCFHKITVQLRFAERTA